MIQFQGKSYWLKKLSPDERNPDSRQVINLNPENFLIIEESTNVHLENVVDEDQDFYISRLVLSKVSPTDAGMYICVMTDQDDKSTFKTAYLHVQKGPAKGIELSKNTLIIVVACLGAFVLVFLVILIAFILRRHGKSTPHRNTDSPEAREKMLDASKNYDPNAGSQASSRPIQSQAPPVQEYFSPAWTCTSLSPKLGQPLPPTPMDHRPVSSVTNPRQHHSHHHHYRR